MACLAAAADKMSWGKTYANKARNYSESARKEIALAEREPDRYVRRGHLALAESYMRLAEIELMTAQRRHNEQERRAAGVAPG